MSSRKANFNYVLEKDCYPCLADSHYTPTKMKLQDQHDQLSKIKNSEVVPTNLNYQNTETLFFIYDEEKESPPRPKSPAPRDFQNKGPSPQYGLPPKPSVPFKQIHPLDPIHPSHSAQMNLLSLPVFPQSPTITFSCQDVPLKSPGYSAKKYNLNNQQECILKEIDSNMIQQPESRGTNLARNQSTVEELLNCNLRNPGDHNFGFYNPGQQFSARGISSDNQNTWQRNNQARKKKIIGIRNFSDTCFAGSLLQCLYHLPTFKECLYNCARHQPNKLIDLFEKLFHSLDRVDAQSVNDSAENLIKSLFQMRHDEFQLGARGSSELLFRAITEEFGAGSPLVELFWKGRYSKMTDCENCRNQLKMTEDIFILHAKDIDYKPERAKDGSLFQPRNELRRCRKCHAQALHSTSYQFESLPNVLVISISDTFKTKSSNELIRNISVQTKNGQIVKYEYLTGIVNTQKGSIGGRSIAIVKSNENEGYGYFELNDSIARRLSSLDSVSLNPKLIFYQKVNCSSPYQLETLPSHSNRVNSCQRVQAIKGYPLDDKKEPEIVSRGRKMDSRNAKSTNRCVSLESGLTPNMNPFRVDFGKRMALKNEKGTSYAGALLQCLYHLPSLKTLFYDHEKKHGQFTNKIASLLLHFFKSMDRASAEYANKSALKFIRFVNKSHKLSYSINQDNRCLWNLVYEELFSTKSRALILSPNMFTGASDILVTCRVCNQSQSCPQNNALLTLDEKDYKNEMISHGNCAAPPQCFTCKCYYTFSVDKRPKVMFVTFPDVLVISIIPMTDNHLSPQSQLLQRISLRGSDKTIQVYEYQAGILTKIREGDGQHSVAVVQCGASKSCYYLFDDNKVAQTKLCDVTHHPRVLFYRKISA